MRVEYFRTRRVMAVWKRSGFSYINKSNMMVVNGASVISSKSKFATDPAVL